MNDLQISQYMCEHRHHVAMGLQTRMLTAADLMAAAMSVAPVQRVQCVQGPGSQSQHCKREGLDGEERGAEWSPLYCKSETSLG